MVVRGRLDLEEGGVAVGVWFGGKPSEQYAFDARSVGWALEFAQDVQFPVFGIGQKNVVNSKLLVVTTRRN